jgi:sporulation protein YlmC with PRC-barrel domain
MVSSTLWAVKTEITIFGGYAMTLNKFLMAGATLIPLLSTPALAQTSTGSGSGSVDAALLKLDMDELEDMDVYDANNEEIGEVGDIVHQGNDYFIVVEVDEWFNLNDREVVVPLSYFRLADDNLVLPITEDQAKALAEYREDAYQDTPDDGVVGEVITRR